MKDYINLTSSNIESEHLCCAIGDKKHQEGVCAKKKWLREQLEKGHVFRKLQVNGKVFIEYAPLENSWVPIVGTNFMYIYCLWVAGSYKENGYGKDLLTYAIDDARKRGMSGLCVLSAKKKKPFLSDKDFFMHYGFKVVDTINDYELLALSFDNSNPQFTEKAHSLTIDSHDITIFYSEECPYTLNSIREIENYAKNNGIKVDIVCVDTIKKAKDMPCIFNNWAIFIDGKFVSSTLLNANSFAKLIK